MANANGALVLRLGYGCPKGETQRQTDGQSFECGFYVLSRFLSPEKDWFLVQLSLPLWRRGPMIRI